MTAEGFSLTTEHSPLPGHQSLAAFAPERGEGGGKEIREEEEQK